MKNIMRYRTQYCILYRMELRVPLVAKCDNVFEHTISHQNMRQNHYLMRYRIQYRTGDPLLPSDILCDIAWKAISHTISHTISHEISQRCDITYDVAWDILFYRMRYRKDAISYAMSYAIVLRHSHLCLLRVPLAGAEAMLPAQGRGLDTCAWPSGPACVCMALDGLDHFPGLPMCCLSACSRF